MYLCKKSLRCLRLLFVRKPEVYKWLMRFPAKQNTNIFAQQSNAQLFLIKKIRPEVQLKEPVHPELCCLLVALIYHCTKGYLRHHFFRNVREEQAGSIALPLASRLMTCKLTGIQSWRFPNIRNLSGAL